MIRTNITKVGDSYYVLIPKTIVKFFNLDNGDVISEANLEGDTYIITIRKKTANYVEVKEGSDVVC